MAVLNYGKYKRGSGVKNKSNVVRAILPGSHLLPENPDDFKAGEPVNWFRALGGCRHSKTPATFIRYGKTTKAVCVVEFVDPKTKEVKQSRAATEQVERPR